MITIFPSNVNGMPSGNAIAVKYVNPIPIKMLIKESTNTWDTIVLAIKPLLAPMAFITPNWLVF